MTVFWEAKEPEKIAHRLIRRSHPHLVDAEIRYVFRDEHQTTKGRAVFAKTRLLSGLNAWLASISPPPDEEPARFFVMEIAADIWEQRLNADGRAALIDHELTHCQVTDDYPPKFTLAGHDLEEFVAIVERHGLWRPEVEALVKAGIAGQLSLDIPVDTPSSEVDE